MSTLSKMKKTSNILLYLGLGLVGLFFLFLFIELFGQEKNFSWRKSYTKYFGEPYDCKLVYEELENIYPGNTIKTLNGQSELFEEYQNFSYGLKQSSPSFDEFEEKDDLLVFNFVESIESRLDEGYYSLPEVEKSNIIIIGEPYIGESVMNVLLTHVYAGNSMFIASESYECLKGYTNLPLNNTEDSISLKFNGDLKPYAYKKNTVNTYFDLPEGYDEYILARNSMNKPVLLGVPLGQGMLYLSSTPVAYTNYHLLKEPNIEFIEKSFSLLPNKDTHWTDNQMLLGQNNEQSKLDYIKKQPPLWWAFNIAIYTMLIFMALGVKRKQRLLPKISKPVNATLDFIRTMSQLYLQSEDNATITKKKIHYFFDFIRRTYHLETQLIDEDFISKLIKASNKEPNQVSFLIKMIQKLKEKDTISNEELLSLHKNIEKFKAD